MPESYPWLCSYSRHLLFLTPSIPFLFFWELHSIFPWENTSPYRGMSYKVRSFSTFLPCAGKCLKVGQSVFISLGFKSWIKQYKNGKYFKLIGTELGWCPKENACNSFYLGAQLFLVSNPVVQLTSQLCKLPPHTLIPPFLRTSFSFLYSNILNFYNHRIG